MWKHVGTWYDKLISTVGLAVAFVAWIAPRSPASERADPRAPTEDVEPGEGPRIGPGTLRSSLLRLLRTTTAEIRVHEDYIADIDTLATTIQTLRHSPQYAEADLTEISDYENVAAIVHRLRTETTRNRFEVWFVLDELTKQVQSRAVAAAQAQLFRPNWKVKAILKF